MAGNVRSRRAACSFCTRSVVRVKRTRRPVSTSGAERRREMRLAGALGPNNRMLAPARASVALGQGHHVRLADSRHRGEVDGGELLPEAVRTRPCAGDAARLTIGQLMLAERGEEARAAPSFAVGAGAELLPDPADGRQAHASASPALGGIDVGHAASPRWVSSWS